MDSGIGHFNGRGCSSTRFRGSRGELFAEGKSWETLARPCALHVLHTAHCTLHTHTELGTLNGANGTQNTKVETHSVAVWPVYWIGRSLVLNAHWGDIESARHVYPPSEILLQSRPLPTIFDIRLVVHCFPVYNTSAQTEAHFARSVMHLILTASHNLSWGVPTWQTCLQCRPCPRSGFIAMQKSVWRKISRFPKPASTFFLRFQKEITGHCTVHTKALELEFTNLFEIFSARWYDFHWPKQQKKINLCCTANLFNGRPPAIYLPDESAGWCRRNFTAASASSCCRSWLHNITHLPPATKLVSLEIKQYSKIYFSFPMLWLCKSNQM